jgi:ABC-type sugar transport system substrate-binding protein
MSGMAAEFDIQGNGFRALIDDAAVTSPDALLEKPIDIKALTALIEKLTDRRGTAC